MLWPLAGMAGPSVICGALSSSRSWYLVVLGGDAAEIMPFAYSLPMIPLVALM